MVEVLIISVKSPLFVISTVNVSHWIWKKYIIRGRGLKKENNDHT